MKQLQLILCLLLSCAGTLTAAETLDLNKKVQDSLGSNMPSVVIELEPKTYIVTEPVIIDQQANLTIDGKGAVLIFPEATTAFTIRRSDNITLKNLTVDYAKFSFTQGTVTAVDDKASTIDIELHAGYPDLDKKARATHIFDGQTRLWKKGAPDLYLRRSEKTGERRYRIFFDRPDLELSKYVAANDLLAMDWRNTCAVAVRRGCENFRMENVTFWSAPSIVVVSRFTGAGHVYDGVKITRGPTPEGATEPRLLSSCADGINYAYGNAGPTIKNCDFSFMGDDSVNLHGFTFPIYRVESPTSLLLVRPYPHEEFAELLPANSTARLLGEGDYLHVDSNVITGLEKVTLEDDFSAETLNKIFPMKAARSFEKDVWHDKNGNPKYSLYRLMLKTPFSVVEPKGGMYIDIPQLSCPDFNISNNYFHDHRARGLRIMAVNGVISNNRFERIKQNAITVGAEYGYWREAGWVKNITISGNSIKDVCNGFIVNTGGCYAPGAISTFIRTEKGYSLSKPCSSDLKIIDNTIENCAVAGIFLAALKDSLVSGNTLVNTCTGTIAESGIDYGLKISGPITVMDTCSNIELKDNVIE